MVKASEQVDAVVVGSGPNGLAAAVVLARAGLGVQVFEAQRTIGGGARTLDLGLAPGIVHDVCSAVHPMAAASPFFRAFDLAARGVRLNYPDVSYAQPLDGGRAGIAYRDLDRTVEGLGRDGRAWRRLMRPLVRHSPAVVELALSDRRSLPPDLLTSAQFALTMLEQGSALGTVRWKDEVAPALLMGVAAHAISRIPTLTAAGTALSLGALAHSPGWPLPVGGSQAIVDALVADLEAHGGTVHTGVEVTSMAQLPKARAYLFDTNPWTLAGILGDELPARYRRSIDRFKAGNAAAKVDFVLSGPVPWAHPEVRRAGTIHVGGTLAEMSHAEAEVAAGRHADRPMVLASDPAVFDSGREVAGLRPFWTYAHVPAGSGIDVGDAVQAQIERFAPGFGDLVVERHTIPASKMADHNANYRDGDIAAGAMNLWQIFARPSIKWNPFATPIPGVYLCSGSTPPGPAVHGMGGLYAAKRALKTRFGIRTVPSLAP
ncbi:NAD(P)/FAD-dependent oxidoreductase [Jiangella ureilytica]|uniref:Pyridine nucleotide-disulfide oxidoreductase domain-containing protein 2 n=1 Tax=Jiangella ureilytica TaxID=2530374 RepID=A0A4R4RD21_9ACTN|nr:NAD(P)/FAD-dependent oxidoreductase [Jiangella ureilytica]TDC47006.1 NAD(P)/FAD-dependent oxidoreductase [Jiangella ureilytica]